MGLSNNHNNTNNNNNNKLVFPLRLPVHKYVDSRHITRKRHITLSPKLHGRQWSACREWLARWVSPGSGRVTGITLCLSIVSTWEEECSQAPTRSLSALNNILSAVSAWVAECSQVATESLNALDTRSRDYSCACVYTRRLGSWEEKCYQVATVTQCIEYEVTWSFLCVRIHAEVGQLGREMFPAATVTRCIG